VIVSACSPPRGSACDASQTSPPVPLLIVLLVVVSSFIKTDHESLSGLSCVHKQSAWLSCPLPARSQAELIDPFFSKPAEKLKWNCKQKTAKMHCLKQHSFCSSRKSRSEFSNNETREQIRDCIAALAEPAKILILLSFWLYKISYNCKKIYVTFDFLKSNTIF